MRNKFFNFLDKLEIADGGHLIESVKSGYNAIHENIILTPVPMARISGSDNPPTEPISDKWNVKINADNDYFEQTLPDSVLDKTNKSYIGSRIGAYPQAGRTHIGAGGDKHLSATWGDSDDSGEDYVGDSGGYSLGGPTSVG